MVGSISFFGDHVLLMSLSKTLKTYAFLDFAFNKKKCCANLSNSALTCQIFSLESLDNNSVFLVLAGAGVVATFSFSSGILFLVAKVITGNKPF